MHDRLYPIMSVLPRDYCAIEITPKPSDTKRSKSFNPKQLQEAIRDRVKNSNQTKLPASRTKRLERLEDLKVGALSNYLLILKKAEVTKHNTAKKSTSLYLTPAPKLQRSPSPAVRPSETKVKLPNTNLKYSQPRQTEYKRPQAIQTQRPLQWLLHLHPPPLSLYMLLLGEYR